MESPQEERPYKDLPARKLRSELEKARSRYNTAEGKPWEKVVDDLMAEIRKRAEKQKPSDAA